MHNAERKRNNLSNSGFNRFPINMYKLYQEIHAQHALAVDGSTGGEKSRRQPRIPRYAAAEVLYNGMVRGGG
jgi:hypothetical protein